MPCEWYPSVVGLCHGTTKTEETAMALTDATKPTDVALNTDLYELTMAQGFWE